ncbi:DegV family EDD domain-containing protein [Thiorhodococcus mannitoliphagus]|uniref:DegV family EDD domain-containing protein n=1 Tax=Thiorhodococcus mannitoliphagus TaxID=329406 RepID=A0A6P1DSD6_9GAMM|nr:DegV family protein [Thiorhodococcus mannitoliphagus]NEX20739.1 DegV family EDD domain-containing protein [Thiorhodococcus mannitoliphagus]
MTTLQEAFTAGYVSLSAWSDLLDRINVFPVADADTGANLRISLSPLRACTLTSAQTAEQIIHSSTGNSGNIAAAFFSVLLQATRPAELPERIQAGYHEARTAVAVPKDGTMLSVFEALSELFASSPSLDAARCEDILADLRQTVLSTADIQADCRQAGVVDSGALGMYVFFDGFFRTLTGMDGERPSLFVLFHGYLTLDAKFRPPTSDAYCVDVLLAPTNERSLDPTELARLGESLVVVPEQNSLKIHIHTPDPSGLHAQLADLGEVSRWSAEPLHAEADAAEAQSVAAGCLHIMTDAAGSLPRELARRYNISLLDSYIIHGDSARPESLCDPVQIYELMRHKHRLTTAQASLAERHQRYRTVLEEFGKTLYLCVGSAFTGNHAVALAWQEQQDRDQLLEVIDTGAASGRLGLIALLSARLAQRTADADAVRHHARHLSRACREYVFIDSLQYLAAGGRVSRSSGLFGHLLGLKPIISPTAAGVKKAGMVRSRDAQLAFACDTVRREITTPARAVLLLQYSDNEPWVREMAQPQLHSLLPGAEFHLLPLSLTSGVHMGPGTWSLAFAEEP